MVAICKDLSSLAGLWKVAVRKHPSHKWLGYFQGQRRDAENGNRDGRAPQQSPSRAANGSLGWTNGAECGRPRPLQCPDGNALRQSDADGFTTLQRPGTGALRVVGGRAPGWPAAKTRPKQFGMYNFLAVGCDFEKIPLHGAKRHRETKTKQHQEKLT